ncbi:MAG: hypothetical protein ONA90_02410 [candidate division KSB1 bacterium]|nr:hypothetical protein [candidate division KSB1 bacterium]
MKTRQHFFAIHFSVIAFELFCPQLDCLSEKLAALGILPALVCRQEVCATFCPFFGDKPAKKIFYLRGTSYQRGGAAGWLFEEHLSY